MSESDSDSSYGPILWSRRKKAVNFADHHAIIKGGRNPDGFNSQSHMYIRVGGGYRHSYLYLKAIADELERELEMRRRELAGIAEGGMRAVRTYIRTKSGRLIERIIFMNEADFRAFQEAIASGLDEKSILAKYLSKTEVEGLESYEKDEQVAIKTYVRTKSGRLIERIVYISKSDFDAINRGELDANALLHKRMGLKEGETIEGFQEEKMHYIIAKVRTKSGRLIEKRIAITDEDYRRLKETGDLNAILGKYATLDDDATFESWDKMDKPAALKRMKIMVRTKSGRLVEKTIVMTEAEYEEFLKAGGDAAALQKFVPDGQIESWEKASTLYEGSDCEDANAGDILVDADGNVYEVVVDPVTGKKMKKMIKAAGQVFRTKSGRIITQAEIEKRNNAKRGKRDVNSESDYSYKSVYSAGGTRHVRRKKKNQDGTYQDSESYHSDQDEEGMARRRARRRQRKHGPDSANSYYSVVSAGGTRHVRRKKRNPDGTYGDSESYHSDDSLIFNKAAKALNAERKAKQQKSKQYGGEDSEHSYYSDYSVGGTRKVNRRWVDFFQDRVI
ncbi:hypothetical protein Ciccas_010692 [Cichlidogyrus casuarinus]|uniref:Uncharacterized protein n=1 Tax=Cichlidogyrus casuarinus TaxID=1844966 RepID=A0ABD2PTE6_9PLAT